MWCVWCIQSTRTYYYLLNRNRRGLTGIIIVFDEGIYLVAFYSGQKTLDICTRARQTLFFSKTHTHTTTNRHKINADIARWTYAAHRTRTPRETYRSDKIWSKSRKSDVRCVMLLLSACLPIYYLLSNLTLMIRVSMANWFSCEDVKVLEVQCEHDVVWRSVCVCVWVPSAVATATSTQSMHKTGRRQMKTNETNKTKRWRIQKKKKKDEQLKYGE